MMKVDLFYGLVCAILGAIAGYTWARPYWFRKPVILRTIPKDEAKELIEDYIKNNEGKWTSDLVFDLGLTVDLVLEVTKELMEEGKIHPVDPVEEVEINGEG